MAIESLQSYLIDLGFRVNNSEFNKARQTLDSLGRLVQSQTQGIAKNFTIAATSVVGALTTITGATAGMVTQVAKADMEYQKLATRMWTTKAIAKDLKTVLDAMGESFEDVALNPELRAQFMELRNLGRSMQTPMDSSGQLKGVRGLIFEFTKLKLSVTYSMEWISYYLIKYFQGPLKDVKKTLEDLRDKFINDMPNWTRKAAQGLATLIGLLSSLGRFVKGIWGGFKSITDQLPPGLGNVTKAVTLLWTVFKLTPIGKITSLVAGLLILLDDFFAYIDGRESSKTMAPVWKFLLDWFSIAKQALKPISELIKMLVNLFGDLIDTMEKNGTLEFVVELFISLANTVLSLTAGIVHLTKETVVFLKAASGNQTVRSLWEWFKSTLSFIIKLLALMNRTFINLFDIIGLAMQGKFAEASRRGKSILSEFKKDMDNIFDSPGTKKSRFKGGKYGTGGFENFLAAISGQESGGNYDAVNSRTGAAGKYQVMPENWPLWTVEAGLPSDAPMTPENQELVARFKLKQYYDKYGPEGAAIAWYGGEGALEYSEAARNRKQGAGDEPSINEYAQSILERMGERQQERIEEYGFSQYEFNPRPTAPIYSGTDWGLGLPAGGVGGANYITNVGDINIAQSSATPEQIKTAVISGIQRAQTSQVALQSRELKGVLA